MWAGEQAVGNLAEDQWGECPDILRGGKKCYESGGGIDEWRPHLCHRNRPRRLAGWRDSRAFGQELPNVMAPASALVPVPDDVSD